MLPGEIQGDAAFTALQGKLATVVVSARARGVTISGRYDAGCRCPLGSHPDSSMSHPPSRLAQAGGWSEVSTSHLADFIRGFSKDKVATTGPYFDLGRAYREQFP